MKMNFRGLVNLHTLSKAAALLPLYEAVINSIQSIEELGIEDGKIEVRVERGGQLNLFDDWETDLENIVITDNGAGFDEENFASFNTYASDHKILKGCKGVGRILWLKAFHSVQVESVFEDKGKKMCREFSFDANRAVYDARLQEAEEARPRLTKIHLNGLLRQYKGSCPKRLDTIARNILNHCFTYYVLQKAPQILVTDGRDTIDLSELYREYIGENVKVVNLRIEGQPFTVIHAKNYMPSREKHTMNLCADRWVVQQIAVSKILNGLNVKLEDEKGEFAYNGYVMSLILDEHANRERTRFDLPERKNLVDPLGMEEITQCLSAQIAEFLHADIEKNNQKKADYIRTYISEKNPRFETLLKHYPQILEAIPWIDDEEKLELELFRQEQKYRRELKESGEEDVFHELTANEYQKLAMVTLNPELGKKDVLINGVMGLCGESREAIDIVKKHLAQGHELDREHLLKELGDIAWYLAETATALDSDLQTVLSGNIEKLKKRYPDGFEKEKSIHRDIM